jgi:hypothetical protein
VASKLPETLPRSARGAAPAGERLTLLVLDLGLDVVDGVRALHLQRDGLAGQRLDEDLHGEYLLVEAWSGLGA